MLLLLTERLRGDRLGVIVPHAVMAARHRRANADGQLPIRSQRNKSD